jgi:hypothetical protein
MVHRPARFALIASAVALAAVALAAPRPCLAYQDTGRFKFEFDYSGVDENLFNDVVKKQIEAAAAFLSSYIGDEGTVTVKVALDPALKAFASAAASEWVTNEDNKAMPKAGGIAFQQKSIQEASQKKTGIFALVMHELFHILGFSEGCKAFATRTSGGQFTGEAVTRFHGGPVPLAGGHFPQGFADKAGVNPRMCVGGGDTLSLLDLAVLSDLGYSVPAVRNADKLVVLGFKMPQGAASFDADSGTAILEGGDGDDVLVAGDGKWQLSGGAGDDILVSGEGETTMYGRNAQNTPGKDTFYIRTATGKHTIQNFGPEDVICLDPEFKIDDLDAFLKDTDRVQPAKAPNGATFSGRFILKLSDGVQVTVQHKDFKNLTPANFRSEAYKP